MKQACCVILFLFALVANAQAVNTEPVSTAKLQIKPEYPGGLKAFYGYISRNFKSPKVEEDMEAKIAVSFVIERDGTMSDIKIIKDPGLGLGAEAARVLAACPETWQPGIQNGKPVRASYVLPIVLKLKADKKKQEPKPEPKKED